MKELTSAQEDFVLESYREEAHKDDILLKKIERRFENDRTKEDSNSDMPRVW